MNVFANITLATLIVVYIVDVSGFTDSWLAALSRWLGHTVRSFKPFSCSTCMTWWTGIIIAAATGNFIFPVLAYCTLMAFLAPAIGQLALAIRDIILKAVDKLWDITK